MAATRARATTVLFAVHAAACAAAPPPPAGDDGWLSAPRPVERVPTAAGAGLAARALVPEAERVPLLDAVGWSALRVVPGRDRSEHLGGRYARTIRLNEVAGDYLALAPGRKLPAGALVVQLHHAGESDAVVSAFAMLKHREGFEEHGGWEYLVLDASLRVAARGGLGACSRCHLESPHDSLFGPPER
jgi:hypothetical protein